MHVLYLKQGGFRAERIPGKRGCIGWRACTFRRGGKPCALRSLCIRRPGCALAAGCFSNPCQQQKSHQPFGWWLWSEWRESNSRPLEPHSSALPNCATPGYAALSRSARYIIATDPLIVKTFLPKKSDFFFSSLEICKKGDPAMFSARRARKSAVRYTLSMTA